MKTVIVGDPGKAWTSNPRTLTEAEKTELKFLPYIEAVKRHRELTNSDLGAAVRAVKNL